MLIDIFGYLQNYKFTHPFRESGGSWIPVIINFTSYIANLFGPFYVLRHYNTEGVGGERVGVSDHTCLGFFFFFNVQNLIVWL